MSAHCCPPVKPAIDPRFRRVLWVALGVNAALFVVEVVAAVGTGSVSLLADAIDFFGDAANYALSLAVLGMAATVRAKASMVKAACMAGFGVIVLGRATWAASVGGVPEPLAMGAIGLLALAANLGVALLLYRHRGGDSNARSAWICSRNDAIGNVAVMLAALGVAGTGTGWPDLSVAVLMAALAISGAVTVGRQARTELRQAAP
ncbi:MAG: cation transporter [Pseudomonadota bacterium]